MAEKNAPARIWCAPEGEYGQGFDALRLHTWSDKQEYRDGHEAQYIRADIADKLVEALKAARIHLVTLGGDVVEADGKIVSDAIQAAVLHVIDAALSRHGEGK